MSYYPPPPENDDYSQHNHHRQPLHHQASNRENIGWNNDDYSRLPIDSQNNIMSSKFNQYSQNNTMSNNYNNGCTNSQQCDNNHHHNRNGGGGNPNPNILKRAAKRRVKHDLPGPAGNWFRQKKQQKSAAAAVKNRRQSNAARNTEQGDRTQLQSNTTAIATITNDGESTDVQDSKPINSSSPLNETKTKPQDEQLFHDHSSDLHECNAWNFMCTTLNRIVPPANLLLHNNHPTTTTSSTTTTTTSAYTRYKATLRTSIPNNYALIHEIHEGRYDTCHLDKELHSNDLHVPLFIGYVASVQCHAHSDWTALLVDEMQSVAKYHGSGGGSSNVVGRGGGGVLCWIEERLVKQHANWIRPGVVWMIEGAKLALFASLEDDEEEDVESHDNHTNSSNNNNNQNGSGSSEMTMVDTSPSTDISRGGGSIDRMILVGESSLVYAWTPEEASCTFTHQEFSDLMERRCDLGLMRGEELPDDDKEENKEEVEEKEEVVAYDGDVMTSESDTRKKNHDNDDNNDEDDDAALIVETSKDQTAEIIDITVSTEAAPVASEQVLETCSAANNDKPMHTESEKEHNTKCIPQEVNGELTDATKPRMKNLSNPYANKKLSQVTPHEEIATKLSDEGIDNREDEVLDSSVQVQPKLSSRLSPVQAKVLNVMPETKGSSVDHAQNPQLQITNRPDQQIQDDTDNTFDDMLDEDSLKEVLHHNVEGKPDNIVNETTSKGNDSFDDMLDEDYLDITPCKKKDEIGGKLDSKMNTPGVDSFDDMLDEDSFDVDTPNVGKVGFKTSTPGGDSFDDMLDDDSDDNIEAMFQTTKDPQTKSGNLYSPLQGNTILDKDDLDDLGDEDDDDF